MKKFKLIREFRNLGVGTVFDVTDDDGVFLSITANNNPFSLDVFETLLQVGGFVEEINDVNANRWTPALNQTFFYITGSGEIKAKVWTGSDWCMDCRNTFGVFSDELNAFSMLDVLKKRAVEYYQ